MSLARRASSLLRLSPSGVSWGPASVFPVGSSRCSLGGGVGSAPVSSGAWVSVWAPGPYGPGGVLSVVLLTACVQSVVGTAVGWAVPTGRYAPRRVPASVGACGSCVAGWGPWCCALVGASVPGARDGNRAEAGLVAG